MEVGGKGILDIVDGVPNLESLKKLIETLENPLVLEKDKQYTLFAPTNIAIEEFEEKLKEIKLKSKMLDLFLKGHIIEGRFLYNHLDKLWTPSINLKTLNNEAITIENSNKNLEFLLKKSADVGNVFQYDIESKSDSNKEPGNLIYLIDSVIKLKEGT